MTTAAVTSDYVCIQCGPDPAGPAAHAETHHTMPDWDDAARIDAAHLEHQRDWSRETFGPGSRLNGVLAHIRKELKEIEEAPEDPTEWADLIILAFDGAMREGHDPQTILDAIVGKQARNETRTWPDWRTMSPDQPIEHVR